ncbi:hypothetical protein EDB92DRAFT_1944152 [Lactarius akahatsu]|uniref:F-box domain-containing protein n=1 Tax=Lactarius akahatsu TaxID=416441 RepID=A0AAD4Q9G0_9AGAM|nr:hypothetical protein EDB92DRAFT_1944152 [Lactarius akahatsu]
MSVRGMVETDFPEIALDFCAFPSSVLALRPPVEILQEIFLFLADLYPPPPSLNSSGRPDWIAVTYICRYWREAALGIPKLWSSITPGLSISWSRAMIERSAPLPMRIAMRIGACYEGWLGSFAASKLLFTARIRTLRLSGYLDDIISALNDLRRPSPLESLSLQAAPTRVQSFNVNLPEALFGGEAPYCRRLTFETYVRIRAPRALASHRHYPPHDQVKRHAACPARHPPGNVPPRRVALPRLSLLSFHGTPRHLVTLSSHLDVPPTLRRQLFWSTGPILMWHNLAEMFTNTQAFIPHDSAPGVNDGGLRIARAAAAREDALFLFNINWDLSGRASRLFKYPPPYPFFRLASLCARLGTERVEHLTVASETAIEGAGITGGRMTDVLETPDVAEQWKALLAALPSVKTLHLHRSSPLCLSVLRALSASADLLPHLEKVLVVQSIVRYAAGDLGGTGIAGSGSSSAVASREFVQVNLGAELVDGDALDALRERARVVICDSDELEH